MTTLLDELLDQEFRDKLLIYQTFMNSEGPLLKEEFYGYFDLSTQKLESLCRQINYECTQISSRSQILFPAKGLISAQKLSQIDYQALRKYYFDQSLMAKLLLDVGLYQKHTIQEFSQIHFMSKSKIYAFSYKLNLILANWHIKLKSTGLVGEEKNIRSFCFQCLYYFYGSNQERLPNILLENSPGIKRFINDLQLMYQRTFSLNQSAQLFILLTIQRFRVFSDHVVDSFTEVHVPSCLQHAFEKIYTSETPLFKEDFGKETSYIFLFLSLNEYIDSPIVFPDKLTMLDEFIDHMNSVIPFFEKRITVETKEKLKLICYRWDRLYFSVAAFIPTKQSSFFEERFPQIHRALDGFIQKTESLHQKRFLMYERVHLYYDFMFCLLNDRSFCAIEKTIHVFVDFSGGEDYNRFIAKIIASFNYMDVMIDHKLTLETDLYLSDFYSSKVRCRQLTWRHLPETKDWQVFAEVVRELRKGETQKNEHYERDPIEMWREQEYEG